MNTSVSALLHKARQSTQAGRPESAAETYGQILDLEPTNVTAHFELGVIALKQGHHQRAIDCVSRAAELDSTQAKFHVVLGIAHSNLGDLQKGAGCFRKALEITPDDPAIQNNLGLNLKGQGDSDAAERCFRTAISSEPNFIDAHINLGDLLRSRGRLVAAVEEYRKALRLSSKLPAVEFNLAQTLHHLRQYDEAESLLSGVAARHPTFPGIHNMLGTNRVQLGKFDEAVASFRKSIANEPEAASAHINLGNLQLDRNDLDGAIESFRNALGIEPDNATAHSNLLLILNYLPGSSQEDLYRESLQFDVRQSAGCVAGQRAFENARVPDRVLRIGYISPDFRAHSVAHFIGKLLGAHNRDNVEVFCYADVLLRDSTTEKLESQADHWTSVIGMSHDDVAARIEKDRIDILIDLAGHTANNRLPVFVRKPAPIQVNWLGYPNTTGIGAMDYRLTDAVADPEGEADRTHSETLIRLPNGFLNYQTDNPEPAVSNLPD